MFQLMLAFSFSKKDDLPTIIATGLKRYAVKFGVPPVAVLFRPEELPALTLTGIELRSNPSITDGHFFVAGE